MESATAPPVPADEETPAGDPTDPTAAPETPPEPQPPAPEPPAEGDNAPEADLPNGEDHDSDDDAMEAFLGTGPQLSLAVGGKQPTASKFSIVGGAVAMEGQFKKGETVRAEVELRVGEVHFVDKVDGDGNVTATTRKHQARIESIRRIED